jgi:hypothetical protein
MPTRVLLRERPRLTSLGLMKLPLLNKARTALLAPSDEVKVQMELLKEGPGYLRRQTLFHWWKAAVAP